MTDKEREILRLTYDLHIELLRQQGNQIKGLKQAIEGAQLAVESVERAHEIVTKIMKATGELMGTH